jgi:peptidoglycan/LPS O-acetylase OafA/YrhL
MTMHADYGLGFAFHFLLGHSLSVCTNLALILFARFGGKGLAPPLLGNRVMVYLGKRSYGIYLYHNFLFAMIGDLGIAGLDRPGWPMIIVGSTLTIATASLSWRYFEHPLLRFKRLAPYVEPTRQSSAVPISATRSAEV